MKKLAIALAVAGVALMVPEMAMAVTLKDTLNKSATNIGASITIIQYVGYILAAVFVITGLLKLKAHMDNPGQNPLKDAIGRLVVGGLLGVLPTLVEIIRASTTGSAGTGTLVKFGTTLS